MAGDGMLREQSSAHRLPSVVLIFMLFLQKSLLTTRGHPMARRSLRLYLPKTARNPESQSANRPPPPLKTLSCSPSSRGRVLRWNSFVRSSNVSSAAKSSHPQERPRPRWQRHRGKTLTRITLTAMRPTVSLMLVCGTAIQKLITPLPATHRHSRADAQGHNPYSWIWTFYPVPTSSLQGRHRAGRRLRYGHPFE